MNNIGKIPPIRDVVEPLGNGSFLLGYSSDPRCTAMVSKEYKGHIVSVVMKDSPDAPEWKIIGRNITMPATSYIARIIDTSTGEARDYNHNFEWDEWSFYLWSEGNYSCDCNRGSFYCDSGEDIDWDEACGESRFRVPFVILPNGCNIAIDESY